MYNKKTTGNWGTDS